MLPKDFKTLENYFILTFNNPGKRGAPIQSDFLINGEPNLLINAMIEMMSRHPEVETIIMNAAYNHAQRQDPKRKIKPTI